MQDPKNLQKFAFWESLHNYVWLYLRATKARIDNRKTNLSNSNISSRCPDNTVNFGLLAAEIISLVWGIPRILAALLHGARVVGASQSLRR